MSSRPDKPLLLDAVFGGQPERRRPGLRTLALVAALALHAGLWRLSQLSGPSLETWSARIAAMVHHDLVANAPTAIETIKQPEPAPEPPAPEPPAPEAAQPPPVAAPKAAPRTTAPQPSATPAQAAQVVAADAPADLTADTFITGTASAYAGGATTARGQSPTKVDAVAPAAAELERGGPQAVAQPVSLTSGQWQCPWPSEALAEDLYEQFVIVRAWVREDGSVERASVVSDPGYGFGEAAKACALRTRFNPARNARGAAVRSLSPPIRVRFTR